MVAQRRPVQVLLDARSHMARSPARSKQFGRRAGIIGIALGIVGIANFVIYAASKVAEGHGLDFYMSGSGAKTTYISTIVLFVILPIVLGAAWAWSRWSKYD